MKRKNILKFIAGLAAACAVSAAPVNAAEKSPDVNCNGKADYFDVNTVKESILDSEEYYDVFDMIRLKNEVLESENPYPSSSKRTSVKYSSTYSGLSVERTVNTVNIPMGDEGTWTVFIYLCGSDLESESGEATADIKEMLESSHSENVRYVIETGGSAQWKGYGIKSDMIQRYVISGGEITLAGEAPQADMGESSTLADFLKWGVTEYPAENMGVILWNHGGGSVVGSCYDENFTDSAGNSDTLMIREMDAAFLSVSEYMTDTFTFVGFDACMMANFETACIMSSYADYMYASEELEPLSGWNYSTITEYLEQHPDTDGAELGRVIAESYIEFCYEDDYGEEAVFSVTDLRKTDALSAAFDRFSEDIASAVKDSSKLRRIVRKIGSADNFGGNSDWEGYANHVDLAGMVEACRDYSDDCDDVLNALKEAVIVNICGNEHSSAGGLTLYYPLKYRGNPELRTVSRMFPGINYIKVIQSVAASNGLGSVVSLEELMDCNGEFCYEYSQEKSCYLFDNPDSDIYKETEKPAYGVSEGTLLEFDNPGELDQNNTYVCSINQESAEYFNSVFVDMYMLSEDQRHLLILGETTRGLSVSDNLEITFDFDGKWFSLPDGQILSSFYEDSEAGYDVFLSPVTVNGTETNLRIKYSTSDGSAFIDGTYSGTDESGIPGRVGRLDSGDVIVPLYRNISVNTGTYRDPYTGQEYVYDGNNALKFDIMPDGVYGMAYTIYDIFGSYYYGESIFFEIYEEKLEYLS